MKRFWLPALLLGAVVVTAWVILRPYVGVREPPPQPLPLAAGEQEIVWLMPATSGAAWERFVTAVNRAATRLRENWPDLEADPVRAFPAGSTDVPEVGLVWSQSGRRLSFRWYKVTSRWKIDLWVTALLRDRPPPLAFIGGSNSEAASSLAQALNKSAQALPDPLRPLLLLTSATADSVSLEEGFGNPSPKEKRIDLMSLYPDRTFRFCYTNNQMAAAVSRFICQHPDLRSEDDQVNLVQWNDDAYSYDLSESFLEALQGLAGEACLADWAWMTGCVGLGISPPGLAAGLLPGSRFPYAFTPSPWSILSSVGSFQTPNRQEAEAAEGVSRALVSREQTSRRVYPGGPLGVVPTEDRRDKPGGSLVDRSLLIVTGQASPTRRFLRGLVRLDPGRCQRLVVATGDAISFNTVYRDRRSTWPIQDLPMALVFFCHYNPIESRAGFRPAPDGIVPQAASADDPGTADPFSSTGTEDLLLYGDIVRSLTRAFLHEETPCRDAADLADRLRQVRLDPKGQPLFAANGNRRSGTGEHVVCLRPVIENGRVLPRARLEVWRWQPSRSADSPGPAWELRGEPLGLNYDPPTVEGGVHR